MLQRITPKCITIKIRVSVTCKVKGPGSKWDSCYPLQQLAWSLPVNNTCDKVLNQNESWFKNQEPPWASFYRAGTTQSKTLFLWRYPPGWVATKRRNLPGRSSAVQEIISTVCWRRIQATDMSQGCHLSDGDLWDVPVVVWTDIHSDGGKGWRK